LKLLITGGCGFLGSNLAAHGIGRGDDVLVVDNLSRHGSSENLAWLRTAGKFEFCNCDVRDADAVARKVRDFRPDTVFHLAGQVAMTTSLANPRLDLETNVLGSFNIIEAVRNGAPDAAVLYSSTNKVYGDLLQYHYEERETRYVCVEHPRGFDEATPLEFHSPYGCSKGAADQYMQDYGRMFGLRTVVFRHSSMYGGRQFASYDQGWIGWFCQQALVQSRGSKEAFTISGNGKQVRDVLHAEDMVSLYFGAADQIQVTAGHAFNIGGGIDNSYSILELFAVLEKLTGQKLNYTKLPPRSSDQLVFVADIAKIGHLIGWKPRVSAQDGVASMLRWIEQCV
jgi:CDP-paratose 2-epimerase